MGRYSKNLSGQAQKVIVSAVTEYTNDATIAAFAANAVEGELGVFLKDGTVKTTALTAGQEFFIAQKRDGFVNQTPILKFDDIFRKLRTAYDAPVRQVSYIGYNGTSGDIGLDFTGASSSNGLTNGISLRETTPGNQPFPVQEGYAVVTKATADEYTVLASIVSQLNGDFDYERTQPDKFAKAEIVANGAITEFVTLSNPTVTNGSTTVTFAANVTIATGALVIFRDIVYKAAVGVTAGQVITLDRPYQGVTETIDVDATVDQAGTMAYTSGTTLLGVKLTALFDESHFKVAGVDGLQLAPVTLDTAWKLGSGSGASVVELEAVEGAIFDGVGGSLNAEFKEDYGQPTGFALASKNYHLIFIDLAPALLPAAALPVYEQKQIQRIIIASPTDATTPDNELQTIFGV